MIAQGQGTWYPGAMHENQSSAPALNAWGSIPWPGDGNSATGWVVDRGLDLSSSLTFVEYHLWNSRIKNEEQSFVSVFGGGGGWVGAGSNRSFHQLIAILPGESAVGDATTLQQAG